MEFTQSAFNDLLSGAKAREIENETIPLIRTLSTILLFGSFCIEFALIISICIKAFLHINYTAHLEIHLFII